MRKTFIVGLIISLFWIVLNPGFAAANLKEDKSVANTVVTQAEENVVIYFFWGEGCPHCAQAKPYLESLAQENPSIELYTFEIYNSEENQVLFGKVCEVYGFSPRYVPTIFMGDRYWEGWSDSIQMDVAATAEGCLTSGCLDKASGLVSTEPQTIEPTFTPVVSATETPDPIATESPKAVKLPLIGDIDLSHQSLFLSTLLIAFVDGFNPCSVWVLSMLLAITLHTGSRKKIIIIGLVFLTVTAGIYALFIAGLFTVLTVVSFVGWIQVLVALVALFFSLVNIKDYFWYKEGVSFTISDEKKPGIYQKIRKVIDAGDSLWGLIGGTIVLAAGVSLVEFTCTAGFPVLWTNLVASQNAPMLTFALLLLVYMMVYQLDELGIFFAAVFTLKASKLEEKHGRILKLIGGVLMFTLAIVMLVKPSVMSSLEQSLVVFGIAFLITGFILLIHRVILPRVGVHIGSEFNKKE